MGITLQLQQDYVLVDVLANLLFLAVTRRDTMRQKI